MAHNSQKCPFHVIYKEKAWKKTIQLKNGDFDKLYNDLCSYVTKRTKYTYGTQCHITINDNVVYSSDDLKLELQHANGNDLDVIVNVCNLMHVMYRTNTPVLSNIQKTIYNVTISGWCSTRS